MLIKFKKNGGDLYEKNILYSSCISFIASSLDLTVKAIYAYQNSVMGILDAVSQDYSNLKFDAEGIQKLLADPNNLTLLKDVLTKLG